MNLLCAPRNQRYQLVYFYLGIAGIYPPIRTLPVSFRYLKFSSREGYELHVLRKQSRKKLDAGIRNISSLESLKMNDAVRNSSIILTEKVRVQYAQILVRVNVFEINARKGSKYSVVFSICRCRMSETGGQISRFKKYIKKAFQNVINGQLNILYYKCCRNQSTVSHKPLIDTNIPDHPSIRLSVVTSALRDVHVREVAAGRGRLPGRRGLVEAVGRNSWAFSAVFKG